MEKHNVTRGVFKEVDAIWSYEMYSADIDGKPVYFFDLQTKALSQTFRVGRNFVFGEKYVQRARDSLNQLYSITDPSKKRLLEALHELFKPDLTDMVRTVINPKKQPDD